MRRARHRQKPDIFHMISTTELGHDLLILAVFGSLGAAAAYLSVNIPHTAVSIEGRWTFGFMGFALVRRWWIGILLASLLSLVGPHEIPLSLCYLGNMMYAVPAFAFIHLIHPHLLSGSRHPLAYGAGWFALVFICYQLFNTPLTWMLVAILKDQPIGPFVLSGWRTQPYLIETLLVGIVSACGMTALRIHGELRQSRREIAITLDSIGDGVIATDRRGRVTRMNPVAQALTGWPLNEALGEALSRVFSIVNARTGQPVENPVEQVLKTGRVVGLGNHTTLISRDGTRRPIADSAAPVRETDGRIIGTVMVFRDVSAEYQTRESLEQSRAMLARTERIAHVGSWEWEVATDRVSWSDEMYRIFRRDRAEGAPSYQNHPRLYHPEDMARLDLAVKAALARGTPYELEMRAIRTDKAIRYCIARGYAETDAQGTVTRLYGSLQDVTERKQAEAAYNRLCRMATELICVADIRTATFVQINPAFERVLGYSEAELLKQPFLDFIHPDDLEPTLTVIREKLRKGVDVIAFENRYQCKDGSYRHLDWNSHPVPEEGRTYAIAHDITDRKQAEQALRENEEKYRAIIMQSTDCLILHDFDANILDVNPCSCQTYGYSREELLSMKVSDLDPDYGEREDGGGFWEGLTAGKPILFEARQQRKDRTIFPVEVRLSLIRIRGQNLILGLCSDISERKEKETLQSQFYQSQKLESVGRLAGGVAHDLNNLLSPILGYAEMLVDDYGLEGDADHRESAQEIVNAAMRARDLVRQLLAFSRKQVLAFKPLDLNELMRRFEKLLRRTIREDVDIHLALAEAVPPIQGDLGQLEQVIMNLAVNGQDAMPDGGRLIIETRVVRLDQAYADSKPGVKPGDYVMLMVSDTGCGMDSEIRAHLFEPFFTTKAMDKGTGLGLATVYGIVKQHGGNIWVYSEPGKGTSFKVYLPVSDPEQPSQHSPSPLPANLRGTETILLVEDNPQVRKLARILLRRRGYTVLSAENGRAALAVLEQAAAPVDLLLTDVVMPEMSGKALYDRIAAGYASLKVLYMSGYSDNVIAHRGVLDPGVQFIQKPFSLEALATKVREVLDGSPPAL